MRLESVGAWWSYVTIAAIIINIMEPESRYIVQVFIDVFSFFIRQKTIQKNKTKIDSFWRSQTNFLFTPHP